MTISNQQTHAVVVSKMLYASHYFWTAIELRVLVPDPARGEGFWFANVNRSRSDGLDSFVGSLIRGKVQQRGRKWDAGGARDHQKADGTLITYTNADQPARAVLAGVTCWRSASFWA